MPKPLPLITVITPSFNRAALLAETIESILAQDYPRLEYIVLDDGSDDGTVEILKRYEGRIRWSRHENMGQARTVNRGFEMATGEFICTINSDDPQPPGLLRPLAEYLAENSDVDLVYPDWDMIDGEGKFIRRVSAIDCGYVDLVRWFVCEPGPGTLFRRTLIDAAGSWDPTFRFCPDFDWLLRAGLVGRFRRVPHVLAQWRHHSGSITAGQRGEAMARELFALAEKYFRREDLPREILDIRAEAYRNACITAGVLVSAVPAPDTRFEVHDRVDHLHDDPEIRRPESNTPAALVYWLHQEVAARDKQVEWLHGEVVARHIEAHRLHQEVAARDEEVGRLHREVAVRDDHVRRLHREVAVRDEEVRRLHREVADRDERLSQLCPRQA
jgi:glycosyltransferase involved in cell wall biosynthesis